MELIAGVDEAGRGAWAGPVVAAAVILFSHASATGRQVSGSADLLAVVRDSKQLSVDQRSAAAAAVRAHALAIGVGIVPVEILEEFGLAFAGQLAFWRAVTRLSVPPSFLLVDGFPLWSPTYPQAALLQGDQRSLSIAAASVIAKTTRDAIMCTLDGELPGYDWTHNCGYGTARHRAALELLGPTVQHRRSYQPVAAAVKVVREPMEESGWLTNE